MPRSNRYSAKSILKITLISLVSILVLALAIYIAWPVLAPLGSEEYIREVVSEAGVWGPLVFIFIHTVQVVIAPIPGQVIGLAGGYLYGPVWGTLYAVLGSAIGVCIVLLLTRRYGRPFVERFVPEKILKRFDYLTKRAGTMTFFLIFLLPGLPDDLIGFIAGLTKLRIRVLLLASIAGRLPGYAILSIVGHGLTQDNLNPVVGASIALIISSVIVFWKRAWIAEFVKREDRLWWLRQQWLGNWQSILLWTVGLSLLGVVVYETIVWCMTG